MSIVKSFSFPDGEVRGDMFYIKHNSKNFTVIDCYLKEGNNSSCRKDEIINEVIAESKDRLCRFISTHPHDDHIRGIEDLDAKWKIRNFYAVKNDKPQNKDDKSLTKYQELLGSEACFFIKEGIQRKWLNDKSDDRGCSGINFKWPVLNNDKFVEELSKVANGEQPNNISCVFTYSIENGASYMWMGDLEKSMLDEYYEKQKDEIPEVDILFHPHHGRKSSKLSDELLEAINPSIIVIGNAPAEDLNYTEPDKTITQNSAGDIEFDNEGNEIHVYTANKIDNAPKCLYKKMGKGNRYIVKEGKGVVKTWYYAGTLRTKKG